VHTDGRGIPVGVTLSAANNHDKTQLKAVLNATVVKRPSPTKVEQHLCLDKGYDYRDTRRHVARRRYVGHIPKRGQPEPQRRHRKGKARRWVVGERKETMKAGSPGEWLTGSIMAQPTLVDGTHSFTGDPTCSTRMTRW
jgi:hypothetical protein